MTEINMEQMTVVGDMKQTAIEINMEQMVIENDMKQTTIEISIEQTETDACTCTCNNNEQCDVDQNRQRCACDNAFSSAVKESPLNEIQPTPESDVDNQRQTQQTNFGDLCRELESTRTAR